MELVSLFRDFALLGAGWVLWLLVGLSVISIGVMIDRWLWFRARDADTATFTRELRHAWRGGEVDGFVERRRHTTSIPEAVALAGVAERGHGPEATAEAMHAERARWKKDAEKNLIVLGTLGNNVPFVGLFGTVLGIIKSFETLKTDAAGSEGQVMTDLAEALVATAVGLLVAIPAVVAYNYFSRRLKVVMGGADEMAHAVLAAAHARAKEPA